MKNISPDRGRIASLVFLFIALIVSIVLAVFSFSDQDQRSEDILNIKNETMTQEPEITTEDSEVETTVLKTEMEKSTTPMTKTDVSNLLTTTGGCGSISLHKINAQNTRALSVNISADAMSLSEVPATFDISTIRDRVRISLIEGMNLSEEFCNDVAENGNIITDEHLAARGTMIISVLGYDSSVPYMERDYTATVTLSDVHFVDKNGQETGEYISEIKFDAVSVGWLPG